MVLVLAHDPLPNRLLSLCLAPVPRMLHPVEVQACHKAVLRRVIPQTAGHLVSSGAVCQARYQSCYLCLDLESRAGASAPCRWGTCQWGTVANDTPGRARGRVHGRGRGPCSCRRDNAARGRDLCLDPDLGLDSRRGGPSPCLCPDHVL